MHVSFPDYDSPSSSLVKMYLKGDFGRDPSDVNPYAASLFYAVDRFASYRMKWKSFYEKGGIIIADRYTTSNMVHQMTKYEDAEKREEFLSWLEKRNMRNWSCQGPIWSFFLIFLFRCPKAWLKKSPSGRIHGYPRAASGLSEEMLRRLPGAGGPVWLETDFLYKRWKTPKHRGYWYRRGAGSSGSDEIVHRGRRAGF